MTSFCFFRQIKVFFNELKLFSSWPVLFIYRTPLCMFDYNIFFRFFAQCSTLEANTSLNIEIHLIMFHYSVSPRLCKHFAHPTVCDWPKFFLRYLPLKWPPSPPIKSFINYSFVILFHLIHANILRTPLCMFDNYFFRHFLLNVQL